MLNDLKQLPELRYMRQFHDDVSPNFNYEQDIFNKSLSPYLFQNVTMYNFLDKLRPMMAIFFDQVNLIKNFKNYMVDKYHYKQLG
jgi:hypothetical protein